LWASQGDDGKISLHEIENTGLETARVKTSILNALPSIVPSPLIHEIPLFELRPARIVQDGPSVTGVTFLDIQELPVLDPYYAQSQKPKIHLEGESESHAMPKRRNQWNVPEQQWALIYKALNSAPTTSRQKDTCWLLLCRSLYAG